MSHQCQDYDTISMNENDQRIAIAEACGWIKFWQGIGEDEGRGHWEWHLGNKNLRSPPDYLHDLNAMFEAEEWLNKHDAEKACAYDLEWLPKVAGAVDQPSGFVNTMRLFHATAAQRAEAFLKCIGKWKD